MKKNETRVWVTVHPEIMKRKIKLELGLPGYENHYAEACWTWTPPKGGWNRHGGGLGGCCFQLPPAKLKGEEAPRRRRR
jgi:hypothetical protein